MMEPWEKQLNMMGLGGSVSTPPEGVVARVLVVRSFEELDMQSVDVGDGGGGSGDGVEA